MAYSNFVDRNNHTPRCQGLLQAVISRVFCSAPYQLILVKRYFLFRMYKLLALTQRYKLARGVCPLYICVYVSIVKQKPLHWITKRGSWIVHGKSLSPILFGIKKSAVKVGGSLHSSECQSSSFILRKYYGCEWVYVAVGTTARQLDCLEHTTMNQLMT